MRYLLSSFVINYIEIKNKIWILKNEKYCFLIRYVEIEGFKIK